MEVNQNKEKTLSYTLIYDSECPLCVRFKQSLERLSDAKVMQFSSVNDDETYLKHPQLKKEECEEVIHLIDSNGQIYTGKIAIKKIVELIPASSKFTWLIESDVGEKAIDYFHTTAEFFRKRLKNHCPRCKKNH